MIPWWRVEFGKASADAAHDAVMERHMTMGPLTAEFEKNLATFLDVPHVIATSSGTAALTLALLAAGVGSGDEVIVPNRTWISTAHAPHLLGAKVVLVDVMSEKPILSAEAFAAAITPRTKAVLPVHLNGRLADMNAINAIAAERGIIVIEDACQAFFSRFPDGRAAGTKSFAGCFSFAIGKPLSCGQGGAVVTHNPDVAHRLRLARTHGTADVTMAHWEMLGGNFRFWDLPASVALVQLGRAQELQQSMLIQQKRYRKDLTDVAGLTFLTDDVAPGEVPIYAECLCERRDDLVRFLSENDIQARPYYANINTAPQFAKNNPKQYPNSDIFAKQCLVLPSGPDQFEEDINHVLTVIADWNRSNGTKNYSFSS